MIVCVCNRISDREIARHAHAGMSFDDIQLELGVATVCGSCERCARDVVDQCSALHPACALAQADPVQQRVSTPSADPSPVFWLRLGAPA
ncbi:MAG: (2Fe-2S)-binding protein [Burkholderiaceae bacterium]